jgi:hypothetical protein
VILNVGLSAGILDSQLFTMLVVMAIVTTVMTEPVLRLVYPNEQQQRDIEEADTAAYGGPDAYQVILPLSVPARAGNLLRTAVDIVGDKRPSRVLITRLDQVTRRRDLGRIIGEVDDGASWSAALHHLMRTAELRGISWARVSEFYVDPAKDLIDKVLAVQADLLLYQLPRESLWDPNQHAFVHELVRNTRTNVAVLSEPKDFHVDSSHGYGVGIVLTYSPHDAAALDMSMRAARSRNAQVYVFAPQVGKYRDAVEADSRLDSLVEESERYGSRPRFVSGDRTVDEISRRSNDLGLVFTSIDEDWLESDCLGSTASELLLKVDRPIVLVRASLTRRRALGVLDGGIPDGQT